MDARNGAACHPLSPSAACCCRLPSTSTIKSDHNLVVLEPREPLEVSTKDQQPPDLNCVAFAIWSIDRLLFLYPIKPKKQGNKNKLGGFL
ncbi:unnamed protein product [Lactuca virosa]|uniref:Uncharacterized protein n=1 Tax=Lactuca virosa TaxID=75947 RepID=A0AAU9M337_9ASTR|nr:unnamed protein product [Lactuca virosa]